MPAERGWGRAALAAVVMILLSVAGLLYAPDRILAFLSTRVTPHARDALVTAWVVVVFIVLSWVFVRLQRRERA